MASDVCHGTEIRKEACRLHISTTNLGQEDNWEEEVALTYFFLVVPLWGSNEDKAIRKEAPVMKRCLRGY